MATRRLALEDGTIFRGTAFGARQAAASTGEVVFNTAMTGYTEALTDPSYAGQILTFTAPMIGNYGVSRLDMESARPQIAGVVVRELARLHSCFRADVGLDDWLAEAGVPGVQGVDTRALVRRLRIGGAMRGVIGLDETVDDAALVELARRSPVMSGRNLVRGAQPASGTGWQAAHGTRSGARLRVLALDCGAKGNILRELVRRGCEVMVAPHDLPIEDIEAQQPDGLFISNGPGDPAAVTRTIETLRAVPPDLPVFGICLGHQLLALALGAKAFKLKFGHRGVNQPVRNVLTGRVEITSQNHGFCIDGDSLSGIDCEATHVHLNDGTLAGFRHRNRPIFAVQYHPEASPGPHDSAYLFDCFVHVMRTGRPIDAEVMRRVQDCPDSQLADVAARSGPAG